EYHTDNALRARGFFLPTNQGKPKLVYNQFGGTLGGPIKKDKLFFFGDYEGTFERRLADGLGLRYEYFPYPTRDTRGIERYDFAANQMLVCGIGSVPEDCGVSVSKTMFAPRFGFAYRATDSFVVRGGYGITNDPFNIARSLRVNVPVLLPF